MYTLRQGASEHSLQQGVGTTAMATGTRQVNERDKPEQNKTRNRNETNPTSPPGLQQPSEKALECWGRPSGAAEPGSAVKKQQQGHLICTPPFTTIKTPAGQPRSMQHGNLTTGHMGRANTRQLALNKNKKSLPDTQSCQPFSSTSDYRYCKNWTPRFKPHFPTLREGLLGGWHLSGACPSGKSAPFHSLPPFSTNWPPAWERGQQWGMTDGQ